MPGNFDQLIVGWAEGKGRNLAKSRNRSESWATLKAILKKVHVTPERRKEFDKAAKDEQDKLKAANGWISGAQCKDNHRSLRNVLARNVLTIDVDYAPKTILEDIELGFTSISGYEACWHSSRRHTSDEPRVRLFMPMKRAVSIDEYTAIVRFIGWKLDNSMKLVDLVSYRPAQMMFKPTCSADDLKNFFYYEQNGMLLDPDKLLKEFDAQFGSWMDLSCLPKHPDEELRKRADKSEDPRQKAGIIGTFCRTFDIFQVMDEFLPGVYIPGDEGSGNPRYTYAGSTSSNGAVVYDNGLFLYSHHGHDPAKDMNVNAWDLVRIHLFGDQDLNAKEGTTPGKMPSFEAMKEMLGRNKTFQAARVAEKFDMGSMFDDAGVEPDEDDSFGAGKGHDNEGRSDSDGGDGDGVHASNSGSGKSGSEHGSDGPGDVGSDFTRDAFADIEPEPDDVDAPEADRAEAREAKARESESATGKRKRPEPSQKRSPRKDWFKEEIEFTENAEVKATLHNISTIIQNDKRLINVIWYNEFDKNVVLRRSIRPQIPIAPVFECMDEDNGDRWQDHHDITIRAIMESPNGEGKTGYGMRITDRDLIAGITLAGRMTPFHPIRDYLVSQKWDGVHRLDTFLIRHLDLHDSDYHRQVSRLTLIASVARIFEPGHKFDFAPIIQGEQGIGKSTLIRVLYGEGWFGELHCDLGDTQKVAEAITGKWGVELPELGAFHKSDHNKAKGFMRRQTDDVRMAYDRRVTEFPRQCICWGTTNDGKYLKDPTGNRSYWPVVTLRCEEIDTAGIAEERDQLWAEAVARYFEMRDKQPKGALPLFLKGREAVAEATRLQEAARTEELHEIWADAIRTWLETPVQLKEFYAQLGAKGGSFEAEDDEVMVLRTAFTREQAIEFVLRKQHGIVTDHASTQNIAKALDMLDGWNQIRGADGDNRHRISGVRGRFYFARGCSMDDRVRGYRVVTHTGNDTEKEDEFDCV